MELRISTLICLFRWCHWRYFWCLLLPNYLFVEVKARASVTLDDVSAVIAGGSWEVNHMGGEWVLWERLCVCLCSCPKNRHPAVISYHLHVILNCFHTVYLWTELYFCPEVQKQRSIASAVLWLDPCYCAVMQWIWHWQLKHPYAAHLLSVAHVKQKLSSPSHFLLLCGFSVSFSCTSEAYSTFTVPSLSAYNFSPIYTNCQMFGHTWLNLITNKWQILKFILFCLNRLKINH